MSEQPDYGYCQECGARLYEQPEEGAIVLHDCEAGEWLMYRLTIPPEYQGADEDGEDG